MATIAQVVLFLRMKMGDIVQKNSGLIAGFRSVVFGFPSVANIELDMTLDIKSYDLHFKTEPLRSVYIVDRFFVPICGQWVSFNNSIGRLFTGLEGELSLSGSTQELHLAIQVFQVSSGNHKVEASSKL